jgi:hypothetical protein
MVLDLVIGLVSTAGYDFTKKRLQESLTKDFSKIYNESLKEVIGKHGKYSRNFIKRFLGRHEVKKLALDYNLDRIKKLEGMTLIGEKIKNKTEKGINVKKLLNDFYNIFKDKLHNNQHLFNKLQERYASEIVFLLNKQDKKLDSIGTTLKDMSNSQEILKRELFDKLESESYIKVTKNEGSFPLFISAVQFRIESSSIEILKNNFNNFPYTSNEEMEIVVEDKNKIILEYLPKKENNVIKLSHEGLPHKIIYPPFNKITIHIEEKPKKIGSFLKVTIFTTEALQINRLKHILFGDMDSKNIFEVTLRTKMKRLSKMFLKDISVFDYDPLIYKPVEVEGVKIKAKGKRTIMFGEKGFLLRPELHQVVEAVKFQNKDQETDIFFLKIVDTTILYKDKLTLEIGFRGNVAGYFPRALFKKEIAREIISSFLEKNGIPYQYKPKINVKR